MRHSSRKEDGWGDMGCGEVRVADTHPSICVAYSHVRWKWRHSRVQDQLHRLLDAVADHKVELLRVGKSLTTRGAGGATLEHVALSVRGRPLRRLQLCRPCLVAEALAAPGQSSSGVAIKQVCGHVYNCYYCTVLDTVLLSI